LVAGVLDMIFAVVYYHASLFNITRHIAGGLIGKETAFAGGWGIAALGLLLHFVVATGAAAVFVAASGKLHWLVRAAIPCGLGYGIVVYFVMNWVVVPLSAITVSKYPPTPDWKAILGHMLLVGLPIALANRAFSPVTRRA
jgi:hypothetical protein